MESAESAAVHPRRATLFALAAAVLCVSTAGPFIRAATTNALSLVFWRMALAAPLFLLFAWWQGALTLPKEHRVRVVWGAVLLSTHFVLWVGAFDLTDYASNLVLLVAQPIIAAVVSVRSGERRAADVWPSVVLAAVGLSIIAAGDIRLGGRALLGDLACVLAGGAITAAYVVTRRARAAMHLAAFMGYTFGVGAAVVGPVALMAGVSLTGQSARTWGWTMALVLVTTMAGHGLMNLSARKVSLFALNLVIVLEPAIGIGLGTVMFQTSVRSSTIVGALVLFGSVILGLRAEQKSIARSVNGTATPGAPRVES